MILTLKQAAERLQIHVDSARQLIRTGRLRASNVGTGKRATWRVTEAAIQEFLESTQPTPPAPRRRRKTETGIIQFY